MDYSARLSAASEETLPSELSYAQRLGGIGPTAVLGAQGGAAPVYAVPNQPNETDSAVGVLASLLTAPVRVPFQMGMGIGRTLDQANQAMPWGGNNPQAVGLDPQAGAIDPSVMVPFATEVAGMATTGSLAAPGVQGGVGMGIRAYHGSPHDFDRFSMEKIGTGEGAQAYGHGLYFAEREGVARSYRDQLKTGDNNSIVHIGDRDFPSDMGNYYLRLEMEKAVPPDAMNFVSGRETYDFYNKELGDAAYRGLKRAAPTDDPVQAMAEAMDAKIKALSPYEDELPSVMAMRDAALAYAKDNVRLSPNGRMYEVDINASPDEFLDWDKPLSEQPAKVQAALGVTPEIRRALTDHLQSGRKKTDYDPETWRLMRLADDDPMGSTLAGNQPETAEALRSAGIKGIRYRDAGSRGTQEGGTSNYVIFDDNIIDILKKYGIAGLMAGGAGAAALGSPDPASASAPTYTTGGRF